MYAKGVLIVNNSLLAMYLLCIIYAGRWALPACKPPDPARDRHTAKRFFALTYYPSGFV